MTDPPKISDEMVEDHARAVFAVENTVHTWDGCSESARQSYRDEARLHLTALVASGYRREVDVQAEIAATFRSAAAGRREYADGMPRGAAWEPSVELMNMQATTLESAALVAEGNLEPLYCWLPSWRWTDEMMANLYRDRATALEQSLPLADGLEGQERSEEPAAVLNVHRAALQEIDRVVGNELTLGESETSRLRGILFAALNEGGGDRG